MAAVLVLDFDGTMTDAEAEGRALQVRPRAEAAADWHEVVETHAFGILVERNPLDVGHRAVDHAAVRAVVGLQFLAQVTLVRRRAAALPRQVRPGETDLLDRCAHPSGHVQPRLVGVLPCADRPQVEW